MRLYTIIGTARGFFHKNPNLVNLYKNVSILFSGNALSAGLSMLGLMILTRALGVETFGSYALITAYVNLIDRLTSFQTWQALIHFGSHAHYENARERLTTLFVFGGMLDVCASILATIIAGLGALFTPHLFGLDQIESSMLIVAATVLFFNWIATPTAIVRIYNKFHVQVLYLNLISMTKLLGFTILMLAGVKELMPYLLVWASSNIGGRLFFAWYGWHECRKNGLLRFAQIDFQRLFRETNGLWRFVLTTNIDGIVRVIREVDIFIVNHILGTSAAGLYKIARELARIPSQLTGPFYQAIYPELSKLKAEKEFQKFKKLMLHSSLSLGLIVMTCWICFAALGRLIIEIGFGHAFVPAYPAALWCLGSVVIWAFAQPLSPAMLSLGKAQTNLAIHFVTSLLYMALLWALTEQYSLQGAGAALFVFYFLWSAATFVAFLKTTKELE